MQSYGNGLANNNSSRPSYLLLISLRYNTGGGAPALSGNMLRKVEERRMRKLLSDATPGNVGCQVTRLLLVMSRMVNV